MDLFLFSAAENKIYAVKTQAISGERIYVDVSFGKDTQAFHALYDTGAGPTCQSVQAFKAAKAAGAVMSKVENHGLSLTNASGHPMPIYGVFKQRIRIAKRTVTTMVVTLKQLSDPFIIGMNLIREHGLSYDAEKNTVFFSQGKTEVGWTRARIVARKQVTVPPNKACLIRAGLQIDNGPSPRPGNEIVATVSGKPYIYELDEAGGFYTYVANLTTEPLVVTRNQYIGEAEELRAVYERGAPLDTPWGQQAVNSIRSTLREAVQVSAVQHQAGRRQQGSRKGDLQELHNLIHEVLQRSRLPDRLHQQLAQLLVEFKDIISTGQHDLGCTDTLQHKIVMKDTEPCFTKQFPLPPEKMEVVKEHLQAWLKAGVVEPAESEYNSPLFCVEKKEGRGLRVVQDMRKVNAKSLPTRYSIRTVSECIQEIGDKESKVFSCLDLRSGFWQMPLAEDSKKYTGFTVPGMGQYQWCRAPQGLQGCPASFSRLMDLVMTGLPNTLTYIDDVLVHSKDPASHLTHLRQTFQRLRRHSLKINLAKCNFLAKEVQYLGHTLTPAGVRPGRDKTAAMKEVQPPRTMKQLRAFLGAANFFRGYIPSFAAMAAPLHRLTRQDSGWRRGNMPRAEVQSFIELRNAICCRPTLAYPTRSGLFHLYTDGAAGEGETKGGLGVMLTQVQDKQEKPIGFASRQLLPHEENYTAFLLELTAAVFGIEFFSDHLKGRHFVLHVDHKPLTSFNAHHTKTKNRLEMLMQEHSFTIHHIPGKENAVADFLSRQAARRLPEEEDASKPQQHVAMVNTSEERLISLHEQDEDLKAVTEALQGKKPWPPRPTEYDPWKSDLFVKRGLLCITLPRRRGFVTESNWVLVAV